MCLLHVYETLFVVCCVQMGVDRRELAVTIAFTTSGYFGTTRNLQTQHLRSAPLRIKQNLVSRTVSGRRRTVSPTPSLALSPWRIYARTGNRKKAKHTRWGIFQRAAFWGSRRGGWLLLAESRWVAASVTPPNHCEARDTRAPATETKPKQGSRASFVSVRFGKCSHVFIFGRAGEMSRMSGEMSLSASQGLELIQFTLFTL